MRADVGIGPYSYHHTCAYGRRYALRKNNLSY